MPISEESEAEGQDSSSDGICSSSSVPTSWGGQASRGPSIGIPAHAAVAQAIVETAHGQVHFVDVQDGRLALEGVPNVMEQPAGRGNYGPGRGSRGGGEGGGGAG